MVLNGAVPTSFVLSWVGFHLMGIGLSLAIIVILIAVVRRSSVGHYAGWGIILFVIGIVLVILDLFTLDYLS